MELLPLTALGLSLLTLSAVVILIALRGRDARHFQDMLRDQFTQQQQAARQEFAQTLDIALRQNSESTREALRELSQSTNTLRESLERSVAKDFELQNQQLEGFRNQLDRLTQTNNEKLETLRSTVEAKLASLQQDNNAKLEAMRATVEEKLQTTLERRLGESFKIVSDNLDKVQNAMLNMQSLAEGVGDLKRVMTNVTRRGAWGEFQLATILEQFLSPRQYETNVATKGGTERVEFAVKLPGRSGDGSSVWLPIDAKFPKEDYERLIAASENGDAAEAENAARQLEIRIKSNAKDIREKYLNPPATTDFAIMFLPTEGLYAEVLRRPNLAEGIQLEHRVVIAGPTTLVALLNSLQMGFRTLAIEQRSSEVWQTLSAVKTEFSKFGGVLEKVKANSSPPPTKSTRSAHARVPCNANSAMSNPPRRMPPQRSSTASLNPIPPQSSELKFLRFSPCQKTPAPLLFATPFDPE
jgi:DNA recombination protein RmuC